MKGVRHLNKEMNSIFKDYQPLQENENKKEKLYRIMVRNEKQKKSLKIPKGLVFKYLTPAIILVLFFISIPLIVADDPTTGEKQHFIEKESYIEITKRNDIYVGKGEHWKGFLTNESVEAWVNEDEVAYDEWSRALGEITFTGENPEMIKQVKYSIEMPVGESGGLATFENFPFDGTITIGKDSTHRLNEENFIKVTVEWDGKQEVIILTHDKENSFVKKNNRSKAISSVEPFIGETDPDRTPQFQVAGKGNFHIGSSDWDPYQLNLKKINPSLGKSGDSQNVLLMFKDLTNISEELTIKGKHESGYEMTLFKQPIFMNAVESFKDYDFVIPANLPFAKNGIWTLTAFEGEKEIGKVELDVQNVEVPQETTPLSSVVGESIVQSYPVGIFSTFEERNGKTTILLGETGGQKAFWKFYGVDAEDVIIQGIHEGGKAHFTKILNHVYASETANVYEHIDGLQLKEEGLWKINFYANDQFLSEIILNAEKYE
jgi:hypothetical protein